MGLAYALIVALLSSVAQTDGGRALLTEVARLRAKIIDPTVVDDVRLEARRDLGSLLAEGSDGIERADPSRALGVCVGWLTLANVEEDPPTALEQLRQARRAGERAEQPALLLNIAEEVGRHLRRLGDVDGALRALEEAVEPWGESMPSDPQAQLSLPGLHVDLAELLINSGEYRRARRHLDRAEELLEPALDHHQILGCRILGLRAQIHIHMGLPDIAAAPVAEQMARADDLVARAVPGAESAHQEAVIRSIHLALALERFSDAAALARRALEPGAYQRLPERTRKQLHLRLGMATAELARERPELAQTAIDEAHQGLSGLGPSERIPGRLLMAEAALCGGRLVDARQWLDEVLAWFEQHPSQANDSGQRLQWRAQALVLRARCLEAEPAVERVELEHAGRELRALYDLFLEEWRAVSGRLEGTAFLHYGMRRRLVGEVIRSVVRAHEGPAGADAALYQLLRAQELATVTQARGGVASSVDEVRRRLLTPHELVLSYLVTPDTLHVFALDRKDTLYLQRPIKLVDVNRTIAEFRELCGRSPRREVSDRARDRRRARLDELGEDLVELAFPEPLSARVSACRRLTIVGSEMLSHLPFEALPWGESSRLGRVTALAYLPSIPLGVVLADDARATGRSGGPEAALFAAPEQSSDLGVARLRFDDAYRSELVGPYRGSLVEAIGDQASGEALARLAASATRVLQIWTHGVYEASRDPPASLLVAPVGAGDGHLRYQQIVELTSPPLVVMAACGAASGPVRRGEDLVARLDAAFLRAGARTVILPSADAAERATLKLLGTFHERLRDRGDTPAEAMRRARVVLSSEPEFDDPFYDANMHVVGLGHVPLFEPRADRAGPVEPSRSLLFVGALLAIGVVAAARRVWRSGLSDRR